MGAGRQDPVYIGHGSTVSGFPDDHDLVMINLKKYIMITQKRNWSFFAIR